MCIGKKRKSSKTTKNKEDDNETLLNNNNDDVGDHVAKEENGSLQNGRYDVEMENGDEVDIVPDLPACDSQSFGRFRKPSRGKMSTGKATPNMHDPQNEWRCKMFRDFSVGLYLRLLPFFQRI